MKEIKINQLVAFKRLPKERQKNFVMKEFKKPREKTNPADGGGNYWIRSWSAVRKSFLESDTTCIDDKIDEILIEDSKAKSNRTKTMYARNLDILRCYQDEDFSEFKPDSGLIYLKQPQNRKIKISNLEIKIKVDYVFSFEEAGVKRIGAIAFVSKLYGYKPAELGIFDEALYKFLTEQFSDDYEIASEYVSVVDIESQTSINYLTIENGGIERLLEPTIGDLSKLI